jgi:hypothetical protein
MALTFGKLFGSKQVNNAAPDTLFIAPASPANSIVRNARIRFANTTVGAVTVKAWAVPVSGSPGDANVMLPTTSIPANSYIDVDVPALSAGDFVQAQAGAASSITALNIDGFVQS